MRPLAKLVGAYLLPLNSLLWARTRRSSSRIFPRENLCFSRTSRIWTCRNFEIWQGRTVTTKGDFKMADKPENDHKPVEQPKQREFFQKPQIPDRPDRSAGWDAEPEWSGSSWSGERWSGRNQSGGRDR
jgi:hypothetical protein